MPMRWNFPLKTDVDCVDEEACVETSTEFKSRRKSIIATTATTKSICSKVNYYVECVLHRTIFMLPSSFRLFRLYGESMLLY